jgi:hypothetical protein
MESQLRGGGTGYEVAGADVIEELTLAHPPTPGNHFLAHQADMRGRPSEAEEPEFEEDARYLSEAARASDDTSLYCRCYSVPQAGADRLVRLDSGTASMEKKRPESEVSICQAPIS